MMDQWDEKAAIIVNTWVAKYRPSLPTGTGFAAVQDLVVTIAATFRTLAKDKALEREVVEAVMAAREARIQYDRTGSSGYGVADPTLDESEYGAIEIRWAQAIDREAQATAALAADRAKDNG